MSKKKSLSPCSLYENASQKDPQYQAISTNWGCYLGKCFSNSQLGSWHLKDELN